MGHKINLPGVVYLFGIFFSISCTCTKESETKIDLIAARFEQDLFDIPAENIFEHLPYLKKKYPPFFESTNDEFWRNILIDSLHIKLNQSVRDTFKDISQEISKIKKVLERYSSLYEPDLSRVYLYTYISNLDFDYPVIFRDTLLFIALDLYLGANFPAYSYLPRYLARERSREYIPIDVAYTVAGELTSNAPQSSETLLSHMIREGVLLYTSQKLLPEEKEYNIFKYTKDQWDFCVKNERNIWMYFIQNKLLFDTNIMTKKKFIDPSPFTKMGTDFDRDIPGRIGRWIGYRIVSEFMKKNKDISPKELTQITDYQNLFYKSNYKP